MLTSNDSKKRLAELLSQEVKRAIPGNESPYADKFYYAMAEAIVKWLEEKGTDSVTLTSGAAILQGDNVFIQSGKGDIS